MALKAQLYGERYPIDEDLLDALAHMPPASGAALGFDRLVMLATGATRVDDVIWTPLARPPRRGGPDQRPCARPEPSPTPACCRQTE